MVTALIARVQLSLDSMSTKPQALNKCNLLLQSAKVLEQNMNSNSFSSPKSRSKGTWATELVVII